MKSKHCNEILFGIGAGGYGLLEILWRGHTHWSMLGAGGLAFLGLSRLPDRMKSAGFFARAAAGCGMITAIEYGFGLVFNIWLHENVWDYSKIPLNLQGQICLPYSLLWFLLCLPGVPLAGKIRKKLSTPRAF